MSSLENFLTAKIQMCAFVGSVTYLCVFLLFPLMMHIFCSADLPMSFEDRVAAVGIATQFQERSNEVFQMVEEETEYAKTQVILQ